MLESFRPRDAGGERVKQRALADIEAYVEGVEMAIMLLYIHARRAGFYVAPPSSVPEVPFVDEDASATE